MRRRAQAAAAPRSTGERDGSARATDTRPSIMGSRKSATQGMAGEPVKGQRDQRGGGDGIGGPDDGRTVPADEPEAGRDRSEPPRDPLVGHPEDPQARSPDRQVASAVDGKRASHLHVRGNIGQSFAAGLRIRARVGGQDERPPPGGRQVPGELQRPLHSAAPEAGWIVEGDHQDRSHEGRRSSHRRRGRISVPTPSTASTSAGVGWLRKPRGLALSP